MHLFILIPRGGGGGIPMVNKTILEKKMLTYSAPIGRNFVSKIPWAIKFVIQFNSELLEKKYLIFPSHVLVYYLISAGWDYSAVLSPGYLRPPPPGEILICALICAEVINWLGSKCCKFVKDFSQLKFFIHIF